MPTEIFTFSENGWWDSLSNADGLCEKEDSEFSKTLRSRGPIRDCGWPALLADQNTIYAFDVKQK
jgi:hypothetical protein